MTLTLIQSIAFILVAIVDLFKRGKYYKQQGKSVYFKPTYGFSTRFIPIPLWIFGLIAGFLFFSKYLDGN